MSGSQDRDAGALEAVTRSLADLDEPRALELVEGMLTDGESPLAIVRACEAGMRMVGEFYEQHEYYLSGLIMAGEIFREVMALAQPALEHELSGTASGSILLATVAGDIHDIGKNMAGVALRSFGFAVEDMGVDVPAERLVEQALQLRPDLLGLSGLVTASYESMRATIRLLRERERTSGGRLPVIIGGGTLDQEVCVFTGADSWTTDAMEGVRICQQLVSGAAAG